MRWDKKSGSVADEDWPVSFAELVQNLHEVISVDPVAVFIVQALRMLNCMRYFDCMSDKFLN